MVEAATPALNASQIEKCYQGKPNMVSEVKLNKPNEHGTMKIKYTQTLSLKIHYLDVRVVISYFQRIITILSLKGMLIILEYIKELFSYRDGICCIQGD